jgi:hypothetical protein
MTPTPNTGPPTEMATEAVRGSKPHGSTRKETMQDYDWKATALSFFDSVDSEESSAGVIAIAAALEWAFEEGRRVEYGGRLVPPPWVTQSESVEK